MKSNIKEILSIAILLMLWAIIYWLLTLLDSSDFLFYVISFFIYFSVSLLWSYLTKNTNNKTLKIVTLILLIPIFLFQIISTLITPFLALFGHIIFYFGIPALVIELIFKMLDKFNFIDNINITTLLYLKITLGVFSIVIFNPFIKEFVIRFSLAQPRSSNKMRVFNFEALTQYLLSSENIKFLIYFFYVIALIAVNVLNFQNSSYTLSQESDKAILQSFVTFIAFDRANVLIKQLEFRPSILLTRMCNSIKNDISSFIKNDIGSFIKNDNSNDISK